MMAKKKAKIESKSITGLKYFDLLKPLLAGLHEEGCQRDRAGNRTLHYDEFCMLQLLFLFNPILTSLRAIQQASEVTKVQKKLGCARASLGSLSEANSVFDAERLKAIIQKLEQQLPAPTRDPRFGQLDQKLVAVDSTLIKTLPKLLGAAVNHGPGPQLVSWRFHTQFDIFRQMPTQVEVTQGTKKDNDERRVLAKSLQADCFYVMDRGYIQFQLFNQIHAVGSSYACRLRDNSKQLVVSENELTSEAREAEVLSDQIVTFDTTAHPARVGPDHPMRLVCVKCNPHSRRATSRSTGGSNSDGILRILTNALDIPAEIIAIIYEYRWMIEIYFRFFKHLLGCRNLLSRSQNGIEIQAYCAIIACLLIGLWTGRKATKRTFEMICFYFCGLASLDELLAHIGKLKRADEAQSKN